MWCDPTVYVCVCVWDKINNLHMITFLPTSKTFFFFFYLIKHWKSVTIYYLFIIMQLIYMTPFSGCCPFFCVLFLVWLTVTTFFSFISFHLILFSFHFEKSYTHIYRDILQISLSQYFIIQDHLFWYIFDNITIKWSLSFWHYYYDDDDDDDFSCDNDD